MKRVRSVRNAKRTPARWSKRDKRRKTRLAMADARTRRLAARNRVGCVLMALILKARVHSDLPVFGFPEIERHARRSARVPHGRGEAFDCGKRGPFYWGGNNMVSRAVPVGLLIAVTLFAAATSASQTDGRLLNRPHMVALVGGDCPATDCACETSALCSGEGCDGSELACAEISDTLCLRLVLRNAVRCISDTQGSNCSECQINSCALEQTGQKEENENCQGRCTNPTPCGTQAGWLCADGANPSSPCGGQ